MKHSELPFKLDDGNELQILANNGFRIGRVYMTSARGKEGREDLVYVKGNAAFIVKACNNHYKLLEALKDMYESACNNPGSTPSKEAFISALKAIKEAEQ